MTIPVLFLFYGGLVRAKNMLSVLMQCFSVCCLASLFWLLVGYSLALGDGSTSKWFVGTLDNLLMIKIANNSLSRNIPESAFAVFQMTFAIITPALILGTFATRMQFNAMMFAADFDS